MVVYSSRTYHVSPPCPSSSPSFPASLLEFRQNRDSLHFPFAPSRSHPPPSVLPSFLKPTTPFLCFLGPLPPPPPLSSTIHHPPSPLGDRFPRPPPSPTPESLVYSLPTCPPSNYRQLLFLVSGRVNRSKCVCTHAPVPSTLPSVDWASAFQFPHGP